MADQLYVKRKHPDGSKTYHPVVDGHIVARPYRRASQAQARTPVLTERLTRALQARGNAVLAQLEAASG